MKEKIKIRYKLFLLFGFSFIGMLILSERSFKLSQENIQNVTTIYKNSHSTQNIQENYIEPINTLREMVLSLVMSPKGNYRKNIEISMTYKIKELDKNFQKLDKKTYQIWKQYLTVMYKTKNYLKNGFEEGAYVNVTTSGRKEYYILLKQLKKLQYQAVKQAEKKFSDIKSGAQALKYELIVIVFFLSALVFISGTLLANHIVSSILKLQEGLKDFFNYLETKVIEPKPIKLSSKDELEDMANLLNDNIAKASANIKQDIIFVEDAINVVNDLQKGKLSSRLHESAQAHKLQLLKDVINTMIDNLESKINEEIFKRTEQEKLLIQQSKLASMGEMIGNIAHQWRQPLNAIVLVIQSFQMKSMVGKLDDTFIDSQVEEGIKLATSMSKTIDDFRNFFKPNKIEENFQVKKAIQESIELVEHYYEKLDIVMNLVCKDEFEVRGYPNEFSQVMMNLFSNAKDILKEKEKQTKFIEIIVKIDEQKPELGNIFVIDNGGGISQEVQDRMFEPYFTTKHKSSGTGIGLYMSKEIIEKQMHGSISAQNCSHKFSKDEKIYDKCACILISMPIKKESQDGFKLS